MNSRKKGLDSLGGLVYSTDTGRMCPGCSEPVSGCRCGEAAPPQGDGIARVRRETKGRGGKTVTTISGLILPEAELKALAKQMKARCGCGGSLKDGVIEIQGDQVELLCQWLGEKGVKAKRSGG
ncbi:translation initiation factor 1 (eIF-1/SUI1) [Halopseudomonas xinjiangensis]|uniref:Translation initiation factor 1 (eIF-1/SUI1) n=1 Tax=Halopseudomonas xinjiangensis TaxID=487184 RepID=A0A1H1M943_9GAMM|nr:translation initiation factor Sui1 [Halopseudomonas xinjiangensis]SDR83323.1 translation initiation factor 1 (eIF-1/SUI1) [Halopseudomonas xinjiangensis]